MIPILTGGRSWEGAGHERHLVRLEFDDITFLEGQMSGLTGDVIGKCQGVASLLQQTSQRW